MLNTIFRNLISNAVKFTPRGGKVEIGVVRNKPEDSKLTGGFLEVYIRDNGIGISSESIEKLFKIDQKISQLYHPKLLLLHAIIDRHQRQQLYL